MFRLNELGKIYASGSLTRKTLKSLFSCNNITSKNFILLNLFCDVFTIHHIEFIHTKNLTIFKSSLHQKKSRKNVRLPRCGWVPHIPGFQTCDTGPTCDGLVKSKPLGRSLGIPKLTAQVW